MKRARKMIVPLEPDGAGGLRAWLPPSTESGRLLVPSSEAFGEEISEMTVNGESLLVAGTTMPAECFSEVAIVPPLTIQSDGGIFWIKVSSEMRAVLIISTAGYSTAFPWLAQQQHAAECLRQSARTFEATRFAAVMRRRRAGSGSTPGPDFRRRTRKTNESWKTHPSWIGEAEEDSDIYQIEETI